MKGTRPRAADPSADRAMIEDLAASPKDKAENLMIVDLLRNDLSRVADAGSVKVDTPFAVESYPTVPERVSTIREQLAPAKGTIHLLRPRFPCAPRSAPPQQIGRA